MTPRPVYYWAVKPQWWVSEWLLLLWLFANISQQHHWRVWVSDMSFSLDCVLGSSGAGLLRSKHTSGAAQFVLFFPPNSNSLQRDQLINSFCLKQSCANWRLISTREVCIWCQQPGRQNKYFWCKTPWLKGSDRQIFFFHAYWVFVMS